MKKNLFFQVALLISIAITSSAKTCPKMAEAQHSSNPDKMAWWKDAKFGMFIHWGIYSVPAGKWCDRTTYGEWIMHSASISRTTYADFANHFNPTKFNAEEWVRLAKDAGQKYIVITSKHHDGFAMFDSKASDYNVVKATPFKRDVIAEIAAACRKYDMKLGLYYSQAQDWYHPGGARASNKLWDNGQKGDMMEYIKKIALPQVKEILSQYGDIAVLWWDTPSNMTKEMCAMLNEVVELYPNLITNDRLGSGTRGDLTTPEQYIPPTGIKGIDWEVCMTMNGHWGYNAYDERWKSTRDLLQKLVDITSKGGNFLLNVGPTAEGVIPEVCKTTLLEMGQWLKKNGEAIYGTTANPFPYLSWGRATRKDHTIYLHVFDWNGNGQITVPLKSHVSRAYLLADKKHNLKTTRTKKGVAITLPAYAPDNNVSVIAIEFKGELKVEDGPTANAVIKANGDVVKELNDNNDNTRWTAAGEVREATLDIEFPNAENIQAMIINEHFGPWAGVQQTFELFYEKNGKWISCAKGKTRGTGTTIDFETIKSRRYRLSVKNNKQTVALTELQLCR